MQGLLQWSLRILGVVLIGIYIKVAYEEPSYDAWVALIAGLISFLTSFADRYDRNDTVHGQQLAISSGNLNRRGTKFFLFIGQLGIIIGVFAILVNKESGLLLIFIGLLSLVIHWSAANKIFSPSSTITGASLAGIFILGVVLLFSVPYMGLIILGYGGWCWWKNTLISDA